MTAFPLAAPARKDGRELQRMSAWHKNAAKGSELPTRGGIQAEPGQHSDLSSRVGGLG